MKSILIISDLHLPFEHPDTFDFLAKIKKEIKPDLVVSIGDIVDFSSIQVSRPNDPNVDSPVFELEKSRPKIKKLEKLFPVMSVCWGNHDERLIRKAEMSGIPRSLLRDINSILGVTAKWTWDDKFQIPLSSNQQLYLTHNFKRNALASAKELGCSFAQGHFHTAFSCEFFSSPTALNFALNVGCLINPKAEAFRYQKNFLKRPILGCGAVINGTPKLYPMTLDHNGKWLKKL